MLEMKLEYPGIYRMRLSTKPPLLHPCIFFFTESQFCFVKKEEFYVTTQELPYDYKSLMHYSSYAFSKNGLPTIVTRNSNASIVSSNKDSTGIVLYNQFATELDYLHINLAYCGGQFICNVYCLQFAFAYLHVHVVLEKTLCPKHCNNVLLTKL